MENSDSFMKELSSEIDLRLYVISPIDKGIVRKRFPVKAVNGRGSKREELVTYMYNHVNLEYERLCE